MGFITSLFGRGKSNKPPTKESEEVAEARRRAQEAEARRRGRCDTIAQRGVGSPGSANIGSPALLG